MKNDSRYIILDVVSPKEDFYRRSYPAHGLDLKCKDGSTIAVLTPARGKQALCQAKKREVQKMLGLRD